MSILVNIDPSSAVASQYGQEAGGIAGIINQIVPGYVSSKVDESAAGEIQSTLSNMGISAQVQIVDGTLNLVTRNPLPSLLIAAVIGYLIARYL